MSDPVAGATKHRAAAAPSAEQPAGRLYARLWRWHLLAALLVIPFVLWQSTTGTIYLWAEWWMDQAHPELRFVEPGPTPVPPSIQLAAALEAAPREFSAKVSGGHAHGGGGAAHDHGAMAERGGPPVQEIILSDDPRRSTQVMMLNESGLPYPIFVDPYSGRVLGSLTGSQWLPGLTKALHGGWPLGKPGSWLLELADGWAIFMILSGLYLWWPRQRGFLAALRPRFDRGARMAVRDLHAIVAVLFSAVFLFFLISALPWTAFWGGEVLSRVQTALDQKGTAGFSPGGASARQMEAAGKPIDDLVAEARARGITQALTVRLAPWPGAPLYVSNRNGPPSSDRVILGNPRTGEVTRDALRADQPVIPRKVALRWPRALIATAAVMCLLLPIFGASVLLLLGLERLWVQRGKPA